MVSSIVKLIALATAMLGRFVVAHAKVLEPGIFFALAGAGVGIAGLLVFASIERGERRTHDRTRGLAGER